MAIFIDSEEREIDIRIHGCNAYAYHEGKQVGDVQTTGFIEVDERFEDEPPKITGWDVKPEYQRAGIATEMVRRLVEEIETKLQPADKNVGISGQNALTDEGEALTEHCQRLELIFPYQEERAYDQDDGFDVN
ncbi:hypothetical protein M8994_12420 [Brucella sp. 21LCYQ03]|nr:hypothetical protein [Brucella sp. 21LCYQ03]